MSIETEKWGLDPDDGRIIVDADGNPILTCNMPGAPLEDDIAMARAIAALPEALALLKEAVEGRGKKWVLSNLQADRARTILRRAGVLP